jgi:hypothetical protein
MSNMEVDRVRADLLADLEESGWISSTALVIDRDLSIDRYTALGALLGKVGSAVKFWIGDFLIYGERVFGEEAAHASEALNMSPEGRQDCLRVALAFPPVRRNPRLSFGHHRALAARWLDPQARSELLERAEGEGWSVRDLEGRLKRLRAPDSDFRHVTDCEQVLDDLVTKAHDQLLKCGYDRDVVLELVVRAGPVEYRIVKGTTT